MTGDKSTHQHLCVCLKEKQADYGNIFQLKNAVITIFSDVQNKTKSRVEYDAEVLYFLEWCYRQNL